MGPEDIYDELVALIATVDDLNAESIKEAQALKQSIMPKSIFKYRLGRYGECGNCWDIDNLENDKIRMSLPEAFNDPYDSLFSIPVRGTELERAILEHMVLSPIRKSMRVCCFSETVESMLMWTHYANEHKGFAIEYNPNLITSIAMQLWPVYYREKFFDVSAYRSRLKSNLFPLLPALHKALDWNYEKEWRLIIPGEDGESLTMPRPKAIYLGSKVCSKLEDDLTRIAAERKIKIYKMSHSLQEFKMEMTLLSSAG